MNLRLPEGIRIDPGGLVKEYAADRAALVLKSLGIRSAFVDLGGDIHFLGSHPDKRPWRTGIRSPDRSGLAVATVEVRGGGLATSGDYERYTEIDGRRYGHIINPRSGWPVSAEGDSLLSVSALAPSCLLAGSLTTLAMLSGYESGLALLRESGLSWLAVRPDGSLCGTACT